MYRLELIYDDINNVIDVKYMNIHHELPYKTFLVFLPQTHLYVSMGKLVHMVNTSTADVPHVDITYDKHFHVDCVQRTVTSDDK